MCSKPSFRKRNAEAETNQRNQAIVELMHAYGFIKANLQQTTDIYTEQCSVNLNAQDLATMAATRANGGKNPVTGKQVRELGASRKRGRVQLFLASVIRSFLREP